MAHIQAKRQSPLVDMTAMTDVAFLLLTFFMLTAKMRPSEPVIVDTPSSVSEIKLPDANIMMITVDAEGKVYFNVDGQQKRLTLINEIDELMKLRLSEDEKVAFANAGSFGQPMQNLKGWLSMSPASRESVENPGVPSDTLNNELGTWVRYARIAGDNQYRIVIKADGGAKYPAIRSVIHTLQAQDINKFNLITDLETPAI